MLARIMQTEDVKKTLIWASCVLLTALLVFGQIALVATAAYAHAGPDYCGHSARWITVDGQLHKQVFVSELSGGDHKYKGAHYKYTGTGYTRISDWDYARANNCH